VDYTTIQPTVSVIICTLNEEQNLIHVLPKIPDWVNEAILVDGHSTDKTVEVAREMCPSMMILYQPGKGKGDALKFGVKNASGEIIVTLDADGATPPEDMPKFIAPLLKGYDYAKGTRFVEGSPKMPPHRKFGNWVLATACNILFGTKYTDICSGYNAFWREAFLKINLPLDGFEMDQQLNVRIKKAGLRVIEVPYRDGRRLNGVSKTRDVRQGFKDLLIIIRERFVK